MLTKERKLEIYTERLHRLALDLALLSSQGGENWKGTAIVADETRNMGRRLFALLEKESIETLPDVIIDALMQIEYLSFNGWLEMLRIGTNFNIENNIKHSANPMRVILEEIKGVANDIRCLFGLNDTSSILPRPELKKRKPCV
jgi:hypothetical protein